MRTSALVALVAVLAGTSSDALGLFKRDGPSSFDRPIYFDLKRRAFLQPRAEPKVLSLEVKAQSTAWAISIRLGARNQPLIVSLDTGVGDTWINSAASAQCQSETGCARLGGGFNAQSSTAVGQSFQYTYRDGNQASGDYVRDTLVIAGQTLQNFEFAVGTSAKPAIGKLGLGYPASQAITSSGASPYPSIYDVLFANGLINTKSFSLWLDSATAGRLIFGGVDTARYSGELGVVPIQQVDGVFRDLAITLSRISFSEQGQSVDPPSSGTALPVNVVLNSGSSFTYLPTAVANDIFRGLQVAGTAKRDGFTTAFADCSLAESDLTIDFFFGSVKISIPVAGLLFDFNVYKQTDPSGNQVCALKIRPTDDSNYVLGLSFFETAYVVVDLTNNQISLAPAIKGATESNVIEIGQKPDTNVGPPELEGLTYVDPADYASLSPDGTFIPYEDYIKETQDNPNESGSNSGGKFFEIDPKDFNKINPADLVTYDQFIASLGGATPSNQQPANNDTTDQSTSSGNGNEEVSPSSGDPGAAETSDTDETAGTAGPAADPGTTVDPGTAGIGTTTTVIEGNPQDSVLIDPITGLPVDQSVIVGGDDPFGEDTIGGDPFGESVLFKRVPAPASQRKRRGFY